MFLILVFGAAAHAGCEALEPYLLSLDSEQGCLTVTLHALDEVARREGATECLAEELAFRGLPAQTEPPPRIPPPLPDVKLTRDPYNLYHSVESDNFVIRWGDGINESAATRMLDAFEEAWNKEIVQYGYPQPRFTETYKMNVYVGDSDPNAPQIYSAPAYQTNDSEGVPMIVMSPWLIDYDAGHITAAHEFFHAVQFAIGTYSYTGSGAWYFEATAQWMEQIVYAGDLDWTSVVFGLAYIPHRSLDYFVSATDSEWEVENYHQYAAAIWVKYLSDEVADVPFIKDTWTETGTSNDPLAVTYDLLAERYGLDGYTVFFDFAARNAVWDYQEQAAIVEGLEDHQDDYIDQRVSRVVLGKTDGMVNGNAAVTPERYGTNYIEITDLEGDDLHLVFEGTGAGDQGSEPQWNVDFVFGRGLHGAYTRVDMPDKRTADVWLEGLADPDTEPLWMVVSVVSDDRVPRETFSYQFSLETDYVVVDDDDDDPDPIADLGDVDFEEGRCASAPAPVGVGAGLFAFALAFLRRRSC